MRFLCKIAFMILVVSLPFSLVANENTGFHSGTDELAVRFVSPSANSSGEVIAQSRDEKCIKGCKDTYYDEIKLCNTLYPPKYRTEEHRECLAKARDEFDSCLATCR